MQLVICKESDLEPKKKNSTLFWNIRSFGYGGLVISYGIDLQWL